MNLRAVRWAREQRTGSIGAKAVLLVIAAHANRDGVAHPSTRLIAEEAECDQRTARRHLGHLQSVGLVAWTPGAGRGANRYQLPIGDDRSEAPERRTSTGRSEASRRRTSDDRSEAPEDRSEALDHRSEAGRASDQRPSEQKSYAEENYIEEGAPPPRGRAGATRASRPTATDLNSTATRAGGFSIVAEWAQTQRGVTTRQRRALGKAVDDLLATHADPDLVRQALIEVHDDPKWESPVGALPLAYETVRRRAAGQRSAQPANGTDAKIAAFLARSITNDGPRAIGGTR